MKPQVIPSLVPLAPEHFQWARYREDHAQYVLALNSFKAPIEASMARNPGVALLLGQEVLAMAGVTPFWEGVGQLWMRTGVRASEFPVAIMKATREFLNIVDRTLTPRRLQAHVKADVVVNRRFISHLGFHPEALMRAFGPEGADYVLYARVRGAST